MSGVEFQEENIPVKTMRSKSAFNITSYIISLGLAKDQKQATNILVLFVVIVIAISFFVFLSGNKTALDDIKFDTSDPVFQDATL